jgi:hypothetical protein
MGYDKLSKERMRKKALAKEREEKRWARRSGPVQTRFVCPECGGPHSRADHGVRDETPAAASSPKRSKKNRKGRGIPQGWTAAEQAIIDDAIGKRAA